MRPSQCLCRSRRAHPVMAMTCSARPRCEMENAVGRMSPRGSFGATPRLEKDHLSESAFRVSPNPPSLRVKLTRRLTARTAPGLAAATLSLSV